MQRILKDQSGSVAPLVGLVVVVLGMATAYSVDMGLWHHQRAELQRTVDLAAYSAGVSSMAGDDLDDINAMLDYQSLLADPDGSVDLSAALDSDGRIEVTGTRAMRQYFSKLISSKTPTLALTATVGSPLNRDMPCLLALDSNPPGDFGIRVTNNSSIDAVDCNIHSNAVDIQTSMWSEDGSVFVRNGSISGSSVCAVGSAVASTNGSSSISPDPETDCATIEDPMKDYTPPTATGSNRTNPADFVSWNGNKRFEPGIYPDGFTVNNGNKAQMDAGVYFITGGDFVVENGATLQPSNGVTIIMTSNGRVRISDGASVVNWRAPKSGDTEGIVFYRDPSVDCAAGARIDGNAKYRFDGLVYLPTCDVVVSDRASVETRNDFTYLIANSFDVTGQASVTLKTESLYGPATSFADVANTQELVLVN